MKKNSLMALCLVMVAQSATAGDLDETVCLGNGTLQVRIERRGGQVVEVTLPGNPVNPLSWRKTRETMPRYSHQDAVYKGHFLCMGRTGAPSPGEMKAGVPMRGEQTGRLWNITAVDGQSVEMDCEAPLDGLSVHRRVVLGQSAPYFIVTEKFKNTGTLGRLNNILQHVTLGPPFLSKATRINSNAKQGFFHKFGYPDPHQYESVFPIGRLDQTGERTTDLRGSSDPVNYLTSHIFSRDDPFGWATAYDPVSGLVIGYVWRTEDYPWLNIWQQVEDGRPVAKGLEFGTTGLEGTYKKLLEEGLRFHGVRSWEYIDAGETLEKSYLAFLVDIGPDREDPVLAIEGNRVKVNGRTIADNLDALEADGK